MNTRKTEKVVNNHLFNKNILATAVATAMFGAGVALAETEISGSVTASENSTTNYWLGNNATLTMTGTGSGMSNFYGTIDGSNLSSTGNGTTSDTQRGNVTITTAGTGLTLYGDVGANNGTGNFTLEAASILYLADNMTTFRTTNFTIGTGSTVYTGNNVSQGYNRASGDALTMTSNITMRGSSTLNVGNGTTITGNIFGGSDGQGTLNINGNFTTGGDIGASLTGVGGNLAVITIGSGNTLTASHNMSATSIYANGTIEARSDSANITGAVKMGTNGNIYLNNSALNGGSGNAANITGAINGNEARGGNLYANGTWSTGGVIGATYGLDNIYLDYENTSSTAQTYTFAHNVNATTITLGSSTSSKNATLATTTNIVITGNIAASGNSSAPGTLDVNEDLVITGTVGASGAAIGGVSIIADKTLTLKGTTYASNITLESAVRSTGGNTTLAFNGTANTAYTVSGTIDGMNDGDGLIDINTGNVTFSSKIGSGTQIAAINIASASEMAIDQNISANETIVVLGTLDINGAVTIKVDDYSSTGYGLQIGDNSETGGTLELSNTLTLSSDTITSTAGGSVAAFNNATIRLNGTHSSHATSANGYIDIGSNNQTVTIQGNTTIDLDLTNTVITDGATIVIVGRGDSENSNGTLNVSGNVSFTGYQMFTLTTNNSTFTPGTSFTNGASLNATVTYRTSSAMGFTGNTKNVYDSAKTAIAADAAVFGGLAGLSTDAALKSAIATMHPATGGAAAASASISGSSMSTASTRMAYTRQTGLGKGMNAGGASGATLDESMWVQIFGANVDQDNVGGVSGYDADGLGLAMGIDGMSEDGTTRIGIAGSFANTDVTGKDSTTKTTTDIDTTQVMVYANKDYADGMYVEGVASYAFNDNTGTRRILVGAVDRTASSAYDSGVFAVNVEAGWPKENDGVTITPTIGLAYSHLSSDAYTETGAAGMNLKVTPGDVSTFEGKAGVKITGKSVDADGGIGRPEFRLGVTHNFSDDKTADSTATFTAGGASFTTTGVETDTTKVDFGLGYTYTNPEGDTDISVNIDGRKSSSYIQYGSGLTVKWKF